MEPMHRPASDSLTLRLDRWASILRNSTDIGSFDLTLTDDERMDLSTLLTDAANQIGNRS